MRLGSLLLAGAFAFATPALAEAELIDRILAKAGDHIVTQSDLARLLPIYIQVEGVDQRRLRSHDGRIQVATEALDRLVETYLMADQASEKGLEISDDDVDQHLAGQRERMQLTEQQFVDALRSQGIEFDDFREYIRGQLLRIKVIQTEVLPRTEVSDERVEQVMHERYPNGFEETWTTTSHIFVRLAPNAPADEVAAATDQIHAIEAQLKAGTPFEELARQINVDASARSDGRVGHFRLGELDPTYERAALALEPGQVSEPVRTQFGLHLIRLEAIDKVPMRNLDEARERVRMELRSQAVDEQERIYVEELKRNAFVQIRSTRDLVE